MKGFGFYYFNYTCKLSTSLTFLFSLSLSISFFLWYVYFVVIASFSTDMTPTYLGVYMFLCRNLWYAIHILLLLFYHSFWYVSFFLSFSLLLLLLVNSIIDSWAWLHYIFCLSSFFMEYKYFHFSHFTCLMMLKF
jgi:hypothetical protein